MRSQALLCALGAIVIGVVAGCGGGATTSSTSPDPDVMAAKKDLLLTYRVASRVRLHGVRCSASCHHPHRYPPDGELVGEVGSELLDRLKVGLVASLEQVARPDVTYILGGQTRGKSLVLAHKTNGGTILVLNGSPAGPTFSQVAVSDAANDSSTTTARPTVVVPDVRGMPLRAAQRKLKHMKLGWSYGYRPGESPPGSRIVQGQDPSPGSRLYEWKPVELQYRRR